jgi:hypothetical protein
MGYRSLPPEELMLTVAGRPFIDVRVSFNSFLPSGIDDDTAELLVEAWLDRLDTLPELHDKVEFEIAQTVLDFCFDKQMDERYPGLLTQKQRASFRTALHSLTNANIIGQQGSLAWAYDAIGTLRAKQASRTTREQQMPEACEKPLPQLVSLGEECRLFGTLPFSILARHGFMAEALLRSAVARGALAPERLAAFKTSIETVSGEMSRDMLSVCNGTMDKAHFLLRYGHLRPSSYDILSPRYDKREGLFLDSSTLPMAEETHSFSLSLAEHKAIQSLLNESDLTAITPEGVLEYARKSIAGREMAKFYFTRNLSDMLELLAQWGSVRGLSREDVSYLDVRHVIEWASHSLLCDEREHFSELVARGKALFDLVRSIKLGYIIRSPRDVYIVPQHRSAPNFIGHSRVEGKLVRLHPDSPCSVDITGRLVCIENADPGFDWIFTRGIVGLVTMFGGTNSHMAIRCAEYGLPAAIGVGELLFEKLTRATSCVLDAGSCILQPL